MKGFLFFFYIRHTEFDGEPAAFFAVRVLSTNDLKNKVWELWEFCSLFLLDCFFFLRYILDWELGFLCFDSFTNLVPTLRQVQEEGVGLTTFWVEKFTDSNLLHYKNFIERSDLHFYKIDLCMSTPKNSETEQKINCLYSVSQGNCTAWKTPEYDPVYSRIRSSYAYIWKQSVPIL